MTDSANPVVKVYPLRLGSTKVPFGQFYGGLAGWRGLRALFKYATDKRHFIVVPIHAYLIDHPQEGLVLVDAGINWRQTHEHGVYYRGIQHYLFDADEYLLDRCEELPAALAPLGHRPEDVRRVVVTHLHEDHIGGLTYLPGSELLISRDEWDNRGWKLFGFVPMVYKGSLPPPGSVTPGWVCRLALRSSDSPGSSMRSNREQCLRAVGMGARGKSAQEKLPLTWANIGRPRQDSNL